MLNIANRKDELQINEQIQVKELLVIGPNGEQMGLKTLHDALTVAGFAGLDLVLMSGSATPAVGKIIDYNKYRYEKQKKQKEQHKKQRENNKDMKEYQLSVNIDVGDFETRKKNAHKYLEKGHKIKVSIKFKGRQMTRPELGKEVMNKFAGQLSEVSTIEQHPKLEGRNMTMILTPIKEKL